MRHARLLIIILFALGSWLPTVQAAPQTPAPKPPSGPQAPQGLPSMDRKILLNGLAATLLPCPGESVRLHLSILHGAAFDPKGREGCAAVAGVYYADLFSENIQFFRDSSENPPTLTVQTDWDAIRLVVDCSRRQLDLVGRCLKETFVTPHLEEARFLRVLALQKEKAASKSLQAKAQDAWRGLVFAPFPYASSPEGTPESLTTLEFRDFASFIRRCVIPNRTVLVLGASLDRAAFGTFLSRYLGLWTQAEPPSPTFTAPAMPSSRTLFLQDAGAGTGVVFLGAECPRRKDDDFLPTVFLARLLESKLEGAGKVTCFGGLYRGYLLLELSSVEKIPVALKSISDLAAGSFETAELKKLQDEARASLQTRLSTTEGLLAATLEAEEFRLGPPSASRLSAVVDGVIREDLSFLATKLFSPEKLRCLIFSSNPPAAASLPESLRPTVGR